MIFTFSINSHKVITADVRWMMKSRAVPKSVWHSKNCEKCILKLRLANCDFIKYCSNFNRLAITFRIVENNLELILEILFLTSYCKLHDLYKIGQKFDWGDILWEFWKLVFKILLEMMIYQVTKFAPLKCLFLTYFTI